MQVWVVVGLLLVVGYIRCACCCSGVCRGICCQRLYSVYLPFGGLLWEQDIGGDGDEAGPRFGAPAASATRKQQFVIYRGAVL